MDPTMKIIQHREHKEHIRYSYEYAWNQNAPHNGFSFECDSEGRIDFEKMNPCAKENFQKCKDNSFSKPIVFMGLEETKISYVQERIGLCRCGKEVYLSNFTNTCECGIDYNSAGQELAPREQWGEDTGESLSDILQIK
jgi:hypothetical protein